MKRDLYFVDSADRIREVFEERAQLGLSPVSVLGVGYFRALRDAHDGGLEVDVNPRLLRSHVLSEIGKGMLTPFATEIFYFGETALSVRGWLLMGLQTESGKSELRSHGLGSLQLNFCEGQSLSDAVASLLSQLQMRVLDLRASQVVFLLDFDALSAHFSGAYTCAMFTRGQLIAEVAAWFANEWLHSCTLLVCPNSADFSELVLLARNVRLKSNVGSDFMFRF